MSTRPCFETARSGPSGARDLLRAPRVARTSTYTVGSTGSPQRKPSKEESRVSTPANSQRIDERMEELYSRHVLVGEDSVENYYESGRGYYKPEVAAEERDRFSICIVLTNGDVHQVGDYDLPFALQSISKVFVYGLD